MKLNKVVAILFVAVGILSVILSFSAFDAYTGGYESSLSYGGDAYTGIQNAAAQTANNVRYVTEAVAYGTGSILLIGGLAMVLFGLNGLLPEINIPLPKINTFAASNASANAYDAAQASAPVESAAPAQEAWFCRHCGKQNGPDTGFCSNCGQAK